MHLAHATWPQVRDYLEAHDGIVIPLGSTEQHGPTGYFGTDSICARAIAESASESRDDILVAPVMSYAPAQFNLGFAGSISVRSTTLIELVKDVVNSLRPADSAGSIFSTDTARTSRPCAAQSMTFIMP